MPDTQPHPRSGLTVEDFEKDEGVLYIPQYGIPEDGVVTGKNDSVVFVRYKATQVYGTATFPGDLFKPDMFRPRE